ncbi:MAG: CsgG/HfaB family protein [Treponema sp.]|jgi:TolB-like protein|nr:CsgG/HfaB family protein [Treponema sp.]
MTRKMGLVLVLAAFAAGGIFAQAVTTLDEAIRSASDDLVARLPNKTKIAVVNFVSPSEQFSNYVLEELTAALVNSGHFVVVDRQNIDIIQKEMDFQYSGEVSDETMQSIGQKLGAQSIFSGSLGEVAGNYRLRFRTINVETAAIEVLTNATVKQDARTDSLFAAPATITGLTWTTQQKIGKGALNMLFGVGSFTMGDPLGGAIVGVVEAAGFVMVGISFMTTETDTTMRAWVVPGIIAYAGGAIFGYFRPFMYDKSLAKRKGLVFNPNNINIAVLPNDNGTALQLSYTFHL